MSTDTLSGMDGHFNPPAPHDQIQQAVERIPGLPLVLQQFWQQADGGELATGVKLYSIDEIDERNETYEVAEYAPHLLLIGDDSGGDGFFLAKQPDATNVYQIGLGAIGSTEERLVADNLVSWLSQDAVSTEASPEEAALVDIYLVNSPKSGIKGLLAIKNKLKLDLSIINLKQLAERTPALLLNKVYGSKYRRAVNEINAEDACLEFRETTAD
ncbi:SMI1/KNR4 family protein [Fibrella sp. WM1]|uniref:SMI1/KNR4 family protein n=1 Tax=Fibrella musci TaxID=3242485 RepID=UPI003520EF4E